LLVAVELCTLAFRLDELTKANIVATAPFGDGAAACVLRAGEAGIAAVETGGQHNWADTLDIMGWNIDARGFRVIFDRKACWRTSSLDRERGSCGFHMTGLTSRGVPVTEYTRPSAVPRHGR
jgi:hypothetical protein